MISGSHQAEQHSTSGPSASSGLTQKQSMSSQQATPSPIQAIEQLCNCKYRVCNRACIPTFPYCDAHILEDRSMPFIQCQYHGKSGDRRCLNPVYKQNRQRFCDDHACLSGDETCGSPTSSMSAGSGGGIQQRAGHRLLSTTSSSSYTLRQGTPASPLLGLAQSSGGVAVGTVNTTLVSEWEKQTPEALLEDNWSSDGDSVASEDEDPLKRAGVYTQDEVINQAISRWERYVSLCREELGELRRKMARSYSQYRRDQSGPGSSGGAKRFSSMDFKAELTSQRAHKELKALRRFNLRPGKEYSLQKFGLMYKFGPLETNKWSKGTRTCQYKDNRSTTSRRCSQRALPCSAYCLEHIVCAGEHEADVKDKQPQILLRKCGEGGCSSPVVNWSPATRCPRHTDMAAVSADVPSSLGLLLQPPAPALVKKEPVQHATSSPIAGSHRSSFFFPAN